jgi:hypothetical protein
MRSIILGRRKTNIRKHKEAKRQKLVKDRLERETKTLFNQVVNFLIDEAKRKESYRWN